MSTLRSLFLAQFVALGAVTGVGAASPASILSDTVLAAVCLVIAYGLTATWREMEATAERLARTRVYGDDRYYRATGSDDE